MKELNDEEKQAFETSKAASPHQKMFAKAIIGMSSCAQALGTTEDENGEKHCGIPRVRFLGTLKDWKMLKRKIIYLDRYGCHKWLDQLLPIINKFIAAIEFGEVDKQFWDAIYEVVPAP